MSEALEPYSSGLSLSAVSIINDMPHLSDSDRPMVERYLHNLDELRKLREIRKSEGLFIAGEKGGLTAHPVVKMIADTEKALLQMEDRLGMNPAAKLKLGTEKLKHDKEEASLASMMDGLEE